MNYKRFIKEGTFIDAYVKARSKSCAPIEFEFWCALWVLSNFYSKCSVQGNKLGIPIRLLTDNALSNVTDCCDFAYSHVPSSMSMTLAYMNVSDFDEVSLARTYIPVLNQTRRKGDLLAAFSVVELSEHIQVHLYVLPDAASLLNRWNHSRRASHERMRAAFESVEHLHVLRVAALLALNEHSSAVNGEHMLQAIQLIRHVKSTTFTALEHGYAKDKAALALEKIIEILRTRQLEPLKSSDLYLSVRHWIDIDTFHFCMDIMHELKFVTKYATSGKGRRLVCYKATESLLSDDVVRQVLKEVDLK